jgi:hypothetical protein
MRVWAAMVMLVGCGHAAPNAAPVAEPAPAEVVLGSCAPYSYQLLITESHHEYDGAPMVTAVDDAQAIAQHDYDAAVAADQAHQPREAARHFLDCAHRFVAVSDGDPMAPSALGEARICYYDAIYAFANAGAFEREGRAALEQAAAADPRNAAYIRGELARPPIDCDQTRAP